jgi:hypothetical protein
MALCNVCDTRIDTDLMVKHYALCNNDLVGGSSVPYGMEGEEDETA